MAATPSSSLVGNLAAVNGQIQAACQQCGRDPDSITLIAASKTRHADTVAAAAQAGLRHFGENYVDEAVDKIQALHHLPLTWHFIGRIQSNKTRLLAEHFDWVHTIDRLKIARRLNDARQASRPLNVLIQVNLDDDPNKGGVDAAGAAALAREIGNLPNLRLRGLMTILAQTTNPGVGYDTVAQLATQVGAAPKLASPQDWDTLSMGMSADLGAAIAAGATQIRIGTALFGPRD